MILPIRVGFYMKISKKYDILSKKYLKTGDREEYLLFLFSLRI